LLLFPGQIRQLILQFFQLLGLGTPTTPTTPTEKRKNRGMDVEENSINYREEMKNTVGAVLGRPECIRKAACRAGKYLKSVRLGEVVYV